MKKTKAAEKEAMKKRKSSPSAESLPPKKVRTLTSSFTNPIDVVPISIVPSKELIPDDTDEENPSAGSSEQLDEEIEVDEIPSTPAVSSPMPQFTAEEAGIEEMADEDVDIGCTTPMMNDDFWKSQHPNSPLHCSKFLSPQSLQFKWDLMKLMKTFNH